MGRPVVHFEILGQDPEGLRRYYAELFGWEFDMADAVTEKVSQPGRYGFLNAARTEDGINGGVGGGEGYERRVLFYIDVPDVEAALEQAQRLGGRRQMGPEGIPGRLVVGWFTDPEGNLIGVAGMK